MIAVRGECARCGELFPYQDPVADDCVFDFFLTVPGLGPFKQTIWQTELICKNAQQCAERQRA